MNRRTARDAVDDALRRAAAEAAATPLPPALRARILAAAPPVAPAPRGVLLHLALRGLAAAAAAAAVFVAFPDALQASEIDTSPLTTWHERLATETAARLGSLAPAEVALPLGADTGLAPLAIAAVALLAAGVVAARRGARP